MPSLTEDLITLIRQKPVTTDDLERAAGFVVDTLASARAARETVPARAIAAVAPYAAADTARRAFHFGGLAHILELDDLHRGSVTHPGTVVVPAAAMLAEAAQADGAAFLTAVLHGYEACCRIGNAVGKAHYRIFHNTATCGPYGAAMAAAHLLRLDDRQAMWALGNAGTQSGGLWEFLSAGAMSKHLHTARAAEAGVLAAQLAEHGFTGAATILEGEKGFFAGFCPDPVPDAVLADPQAPWQLRLTSIKPWPCCRHTHPTIDAALALHARLAGRPVRSVKVATYRAALDVCDRPEPTDVYGAKFSLQHCVAAALSEGAVRLDAFEADRRAALADLRGRVEVALDPQADVAYPADWGALVSLTTEDGETLQERCRACKGDPENPLGRDALTEKAVDLFAMGGLTEHAARDVIGRVYGLVEGAPVGDLFSALLVGDRRPAIRAARA